MLSCDDWRSNPGFPERPLSFFDVRSHFHPSNFPQRCARTARLVVTSVLFLTSGWRILQRLAAFNFPCFVSRQVVFAINGFVLHPFYAIGDPRANLPVRRLGGAHSDWLAPLNKYGVKVDFVTPTAPRTEAGCVVCFWCIARLSHRDLGSWLLGTRNLASEHESKTTYFHFSHTMSAPSMHLAPHGSHAFPGHVSK